MAVVAKTITVLNTAGFHFLILPDTLLSQVQFKKSFPININRQLPA